MGKPAKLEKHEFWCYNEEGYSHLIKQVALVSSGFEYEAEISAEEAAEIFHQQNGEFISPMEVFVEDYLGVIRKFEVEINFTASYSAQIIK